MAKSGEQSAAKSAKAAYGVSSVTALAKQHVSRRNIEISGRKPGSSSGKAGERNNGIHQRRSKEISVVTLFNIRILSKAWRIIIV